MSLPVSQYEALLAEVRGLRRKAQRVQQLARPLIGSSSQHGHQVCFSNYLNNDNFESTYCTVVCPFKNKKVFLLLKREFCKGLD